MIPASGNGRIRRRDCREAVAPVVTDVAPARLRPTLEAVADQEVGTIVLDTPPRSETGRAGGGPRRGPGRVLLVVRLAASGLTRPAARSKGLGRMRA